MIALVLAWMVALAPERDHTELASAVAHVVETERPLYAGPDGARRTAALLVAVAYRESRFDMAARSLTDDHCAMQVHGRPDLARDAVACVREGLERLRASLRLCPEHPVAVYASGLAGCRNARAQRISRDRVYIARVLASAE